MKEQFSTVWLETNNGVLYHCLTGALIVKKNKINPKKIVSPYTIVTALVFGVIAFIVLFFLMPESWNYLLLICVGYFSMVLIPSRRAIHFFCTRKPCPACGTMLKVPWKTSREEEVIKLTCIKCYKVIDTNVFIAEPMEDL